MAKFKVSIPRDSDLEDGFLNVPSMMIALEVVQ